MSRQAMAESAGLAAEAGALHPTLKDKDGEPLIDLEKIEDYLKERAKILVEETAQRVGIWEHEAKKACDVLESEMRIVGQMAEDAKPLKKDFIDTMRGMRMTVSTEVANMLKPLRESLLSIGAATKGLMRQCLQHVIVTS